MLLLVSVACWGVGRLVGAVATTQAVHHIAGHTRTVAAEGASAPQVPHRFIRRESIAAEPQGDGTVSMAEGGTNAIAQESLRAQLALDLNGFEAQAGKDAKTQALAESILLNMTRKNSNLMVALDIEAGASKAELMEEEAAVGDMQLEGAETSRASSGLRSSFAARNEKVLARHHTASVDSMAGPQRDCLWGTWSAWTDCTSSCGSGTQLRMRTVSLQNTSGGQPCLPKDGEQKNACTLDACPVDCFWAAWATWTSCTTTCATGLQTRNRQKNEERNGGKACAGKWEEKQDCNADVSCITTTAGTPIVR